MNEAPRSGSTFWLERREFANPAASQLRFAEPMERCISNRTIRAAWQMEVQTIPDGSERSAQSVIAKCITENMARTLTDGWWNTCSWLSRTSQCCLDNLKRFFL
jgi:hypothetical protein